MSGLRGVLGRLRDHLVPRVYLGCTRCEWVVRWFDAPDPARRHRDCPRCGAGLLVWHGEDRPASVEATASP